VCSPLAAGRRQALLLLLLSSQGLPPLSQGGQQLLQEVSRQLWWREGEWQVAQVEQAEALMLSALKMVLSRQQHPPPAVQAVAQTEHVPVVLIVLVLLFLIQLVVVLLQQ
jgi:hypothetical protein